MRVGHGFTVVEVLIAVVILSILAMMVVPRFAGASDEARESALLTDVQTVRRLIELYKVEHGGRLPHLDGNGGIDTDSTRFCDRLMKKTDRSGNINSSGAYGPYLKIWPSNPYIEAAKAKQVLIHPAPLPHRDNASGWFYSYVMGTFWPNSSEGGDSLFP